MRERGGDLLVVLPTYNERESLARTVAAVREHVPDADLLIVDDGSPDGTGGIADALARDFEGVFVEHRTGPRGLGTAYVHAFGLARSAGYGFIAEMDADGSHLASDLPRLVAAARSGAGLAIGTRWIAGGGIVNWPRHRRWISRCGTGFARLALRSRLRDLTSGFRVIDDAWLRRIDLDSVDSQGYGFQVETAWMLERAGCPVAEVPITFVERVDGRSKMSLGIALEAFRNVVRWGWRIRFGR
ncbi:polyprenol monophosphomannose synthase [Leucobacter zeae]|nr:polyprenol monophosphomannose synthase [Leucobacter zeae]